MAMIYILELKMLSIPGRIGTRVNDGEGSGNFQKIEPGMWNMI